MLLGSRARSQLVREHALVMPIPFTLKALLRIVFPLEPEKIHELRIACLHLLSRGITVVGLVVPTAMLDRPVDDAPEIVGCFLLAFVGVDDVEVADDADRRFP